MSVLGSADWLILLLYGFFVLSAGLTLAPTVNASRDYLQGGRKLPGWLSGLAMTAASLGSLEALGMGAAGAEYGLKSISLFALGSIPALLFAALVLVPVYYRATTAPGAPVRSIPEYLGLRFDQKTRVLNAVLFIAMALFTAGISLYAMARLVQVLRIFDRVSGSLSLPHWAILLIEMALPAALVLVYVLLGGLAAAMYNQLMQFCLLVAGLLPVAVLAVKQAGGWSGLKAAVPGASLGAAAGHHPMGLGLAALLLGVGVVVGGGAWCTDFRLLQAAMAAKNVHAARRAPLVAAALRIVAPLLLVTPGLLALGLPTPRTTIAIHNENGSIVHDITVVPPAVEQGQGLVPAKANPANGQPVKGADGKVQLDYAMGVPNMLIALLPSGMLGLGIAALLACLMSGVAAALTASNAVFACDIYQGLLKKDASDSQVLKAGRWAALGGTLLALAAGSAAMRASGLLDTVVLVFSVVNAPLFATLLMGVFWKRATGHGAFAGALAGMAAALLYHGIALPQGEQRGWHGGWIAVLHRSASDLALGVGAAALAFAVSLLVAAAVSLATKARPEAELAGLMHAPEPGDNPWWKRPGMLAASIILLAAIAVSLLFL